MRRAALLRSTDGQDYRALFVAFASLFMLWGFCSGLLDTLNKHFQNSLHLTRLESGFVQNAFYMGYFLMAFPAGMLARRFGYKGGILIGLVLAAAGAFWFVPATTINAFWAFLLGLFVLASGLACLETIANPYTTLLGPRPTKAVRINLAQLANGIGWISGMFIGAQLILSSTREVNTSNAALHLPYILIGVAVLALLVVFAVIKVPDLAAEADAAPAGAVIHAPKLLAAHRLIFGVAAQFFYVAAQTAVFSFFINYAVANLAALSDRDAGRLQAAAFSLFALGRLLGTLLFGALKPHVLLAAYAVINIVLVIVALGHGGMIGVGALMGSFFFMSIMFPTIFALSIDGLGERTKLGSSLLVMSIVGGAVAAPLTGWMADIANVNLALTVPLVCFGVVALYAVAWPRLGRSAAAPIVG